MNIQMVTDGKNKNEYLACKPTDTSGAGCSGKLTEANSALGQTDNPGGQYPKLQVEDK